MPATAAAVKAWLRREHERRHAAFCRGGVDLLDEVVAVGATREETRPGIDAELDDHLAELIAEAVIADEDELRQAAIAKPAAVASENDAPVATGGLGEAPPREVRAVEHVAAERAEPSGEAPEHLVGHEFGAVMRLHGSDRNVICSSRERKVQFFPRQGAA